MINHIDDGAVTPVGPAARLDPEVLLDAAPDGMVGVDASGAIRFVNRQAEVLFGYTRDELLGRPVELLVPEALRAAHAVHRQVYAGHPVARAMGEGLALTGQRRDGACFPVDISLTSITTDAGPLFVAAVRDVSARKAAEEALRGTEERLRSAVEARLLHQALHDPLTGLPNRTLLMDRLAQALARAQRVRALTGVMFLDLDRFKTVNDTLGHEAGDRLLVEAAQRLQAVVRRGDTAARLGGDEFVVVCEDVSSRTEGHEIGQRILDAFAPPFSIRGQQVTIGVSVGAVLTQDAGRRPAELLRSADGALYRAKRRGRGRLEVYDDEVLHLDSLGGGGEPNDEVALRAAMARREFCLLYQPVASIATGRLVGFEALVRWRHPGRGLLTPGEFLQSAEDAGLIVALGTLVLESACREAAGWRVEGLSLSVNLSPGQWADPDLASTVAETLSTTGLPPQALSFDLPETGLTGISDAALQAIGSLQAEGVQFSIDDFGIGSTSLQILARIRPDQVKVDRILVAELGRSQESETVVGAAVGLAHQLGIGALAEGAETPEQLEMARSLGCDLAQGYLIGRPGDARSVQALLDQPPGWWGAGKLTEDPWRPPRR